jgi:hypothetical protein
LKWDNAYYNSDVLSQGFWKMMTQQGKLNNGEEIDYACGLFIDEYKGLKTISHGGAFVGFRADIIRFPEQGVSIAVFANRGDANPSRKVRQVADLVLEGKFIEDEPEVEVLKIETHEIETSPVSNVTFSIDQVAGTYEIRPGLMLILSAKEDSLNVLQSWNDANYVIGRTEKNTFQEPSDSELSFSFSMLEDDFTQMLTVKQGAIESPCKRKNTAYLKDIVLTDYVGDFYSKELDVTYFFFMEDKKLKVKIRNLTPIDLTVSDLDVFYCQGSLVRFKREKDSISGFELDAGRVKNLRFVKK